MQQQINSNGYLESREATHALGLYTLFVLSIGKYRLLVQALACSSVLRPKPSRRTRCATCHSVHCRGYASVERTNRLAQDERHLPARRAVHSPIMESTWERRELQPGQLLAERLPRCKNAP